MISMKISHLTEMILVNDIHLSVSGQLHESKRLNQTFPDQLLTNFQISISHFQVGKLKKTWMRTRWEAVESLWWNDFEWLKIPINELESLKLRPFKMLNAHFELPGDKQL